MPRNAEVVSSTMNTPGISCSAFTPLAGGATDRTIVDITVTPPALADGDMQTKTPTNYVIAVDVSGSMGAKSVVKQGDEELDVGYTVLDITKHALNTIVTCADEKDTMTVISFNHEERTWFEGLAMDVEGKQIAIRSIASLCEDGLTDIEFAIKAALNAAQKTHDASRSTKILLLTDGEHTTRGISETEVFKNIQPRLKELEQALGRMPPINTYGLGYNLNSSFLRDVSALTNGYFSFVPDTGFVGTCFTHTVANTQAEFAASLELKLDIPTFMHKIVRVVGYTQADVYVPDTGTNACTIRLESLRFDQTRSVCVELARSNNGRAGPTTPIILNTSLTYRPYRAPQLGGVAVTGAGVAGVHRDFQIAPEGAKGAPETAVTTGPFPTAETAPALLQNMIRLEMCKLLAACTATGSAGDSTHRNGGRACDNVPPGAGALVTEFLETYIPIVGDLHPCVVDVRTEVALAVKEPAYSRWGRHYLRSLCMANQQERVNNFKDKSITLYPGDCFERLLDAADDTFCSIPPPVPSRRVENAKIDVTDNAQFRSVYNNAETGCFTGQSTVTTKHGEDVKRVMDVRKGDALLVMTEGSRHYATVECVIEIRLKNAWLTHLSPGAVSSQWHPVLVDNVHGFDGGGPIHRDKRWVFPWQAPGATTYYETTLENETHSTVLYNFIFENTDFPPHAVFVGGMPYATLGHCLEGPVIGHPYFGTRKVSLDLKNENLYETGYLIFDGSPFVRSQDTGEVIGLRPTAVAGALQ